MCRFITLLLLCLLGLSVFGCGSKPQSTVENFVGCQQEYCRHVARSGDLAVVWRITIDVSRSYLWTPQKLARKVSQVLRSIPVFPEDKLVIDSFDSRHYSQSCSLGVSSFDPNHVQPALERCFQFVDGYARPVGVDSKSENALKTDFDQILDDLSGPESGTDLVVLVTDGVNDPFRHSSGSGSSRCEGHVDLRRRDRIRFSPLIVALDLPSPLDERCQTVYSNWTTMEGGSSSIIVGLAGSSELREKLRRAADQRIIPCHRFLQEIDAFLVENGECREFYCGSAKVGGSHESGDDQGRVIREMPLLVMARSLASGEPVSPFAIKFRRTSEGQSGSTEGAPLDLELHLPYFWGWSWSLYELVAAKQIPVPARMDVYWHQARYYGFEIESKSHARVMADWLSKPSGKGEWLAAVLLLSVSLVASYWCCRSTMSIVMSVKNPEDESTFSKLIPGVNSNGRRLMIRKDGRMVVILDRNLEPPSDNGKDSKHFYLDMFVLSYFPHFVLWRQPRGVNGFSAGLPRLAGDGVETVATKSDCVFDYIRPSASWLLRPGSLVGPNAGELGYFLSKVVEIELAPGKFLRLELERVQDSWLARHFSTIAVLLGLCGFLLSLTAWLHYEIESVGWDFMFTPAQLLGVSGVIGLLAVYGARISLRLVRKVSRQDLIDCFVNFWLVWVSWLTALGVVFVFFGATSRIVLGLGGIGSLLVGGATVLFAVLLTWLFSKLPKRRVREGKPMYPDDVWIDFVYGVLGRINVN